MEKNLVSATAFGGGYSNTAEGVALFSLKKRKFIKGYMRRGKTTYIHYRVYPGIYFLFCYSYWNKRIPNTTITVSLIKIIPNDKEITLNYYEGIEILCSAVFKIDDNSTLDNEILNDFKKHGTLRRLYEIWDKVYDEQKVNELLRKVKNNYRYIEGEEHE